MEIYFDNAATTRVCDEAAEAAMEAMVSFYGNPSSLHNKGLEIEKKIKHSRESVAKAWGVAPDEIYFTSGGTESNNIALGGAIIKGSKWGNKIITTRMEHPAVLEVIKHYEKKLNLEVIYLDVKESGQPDLQQLESIVDDKVILISMMHVNNETGVILPVKETVGIVKKAAPKAFAHCDMVQSFAKAWVSPAQLGVDFASMSGHKIHAPKGIGALYIKKGVSIPEMVFGGGQEKNIRPGTENTPGICGLGAACRVAMENRSENARITEEIKAYMCDKIKEIPDCFINGENTVSNVLNVTFLGLKSEILLHSLEAEKIYVSSGSACASNHPSPSKVLLAMGRNLKEIDGSIRFSFSSFNTLEEAQRCIDVLKKAVETVRKFYR